jgi:MerR family transcriptional regulator, copper efflux regulator
MRQSLTTSPPGQHAPAAGALPVLEKPLRVGELARRSGKTVRALHLYEEMDLLRPVHRSKGGFRLYAPSSVARVAWIGKLQEAGFSLHELQDFLRAVGPDAAEVASAPTAMRRVREVFAERLAEIRAHIGRLKQLESDLVDSLEYLEACRTCSTGEHVGACGSCCEPSHAGRSQPLLVAGLQRG